ncbi:YecA family protein [Polyangium aurulentum]|uniref:YecA family protein n=1 Tax=Polyangium aurulentum TaxID=2567896 RepID=UPI001981A30B|nr:SEC-C metal-binding domain-containing protein [Polyangium aurulentum]UQA55181.1 SEC-C domain-containing protein [Polyangium aurulentum]
MGHAHHFLSRLDRVSVPHVELALALYRDHDMVRFILGSAKLPEGAERVAISLEDPHRGPFLVVTREGRFVTCLGEGMSPGDLPVLTRGHLEALMEKGQDLRARLSAALDVVKSSGGAGKLVDMLLKAGPILAREDFMAVSALQPVLSERLLAAYFGATTRLEDMRQRVLKIERPKPALYPLLRTYWDTFWSLGHLAIVSMMDGKALVERLANEVGMPEISFAWGPTRQGNCMLALRGAWAVAKAGKIQLKVCKDMWDGAESPLKLLTGAVSLVALGSRHARLREEARKAIETRGHTPGVYFTESTLALVRETCVMGLDKPEVLAELQRDIGAKLAVQWSKAAGEDAAMPFTREEDVPEDIAMTLATHQFGSFLHSPEAKLCMLACVPWVARAEPEQLFLPRAFTHGVRFKWTVEETVGLFEPLRRHYREADAAYRAGRRNIPTRNGPCPCGSGKKYKRCCGQDASD